MLVSPTFGKWVSFELFSENAYQLFIPRGFAHGFLALRKQVVLSDKFDYDYNKESECCLKANDKDLNIDWRIVFLSKLSFQIEIQRICILLRNLKYRVVNRRLKGETYNEYTKAYCDRSGSLGMYYSGKDCECS